ncbi:YjcQ family protein [Dendrosporobacter sp. 1207_IL3150]|uniref:YjcQ family protein n=1 Tax=Dendrosporobacter sp. 1207_IL3150 TaxID=3084054 RepID=UPI002FDB0F67
MRSDLLLKLTKKYSEHEKEHFKKVDLTGPHDYVLMEFYKEQLKSEPDMTKVTAEFVQLNEKIYMMAVKKLQDYGFIEGANIQVNENGMPESVDIKDVKVTQAGIDYERHLG